MLPVRLATCVALPEPDPDAQALLAAVRAAGAEASWLAWDDPTADWDAPGLTVLRSTWNYAHAHPAFLAWVDRVARSGPLWNPAPVVRWNSDKRYLVELGQEGFGVVPTTLVEAGQAVDLQALVARNGLERFVLKPAVGAGSFGAARFTESELPAAQAYAERWLASRAMLVQPYLESVEHYGERSLVWIDGDFTHAVRKTPRFGADHEAVSAALPIADDEREAARKLVERARSPLLYARVDLARDAQGRPLLMELELIEPSLFLAQNPPALERLARAIAARARSSRRKRGADLLDP
jgi:glutathione synthase/RimK-type ligase-like ATP-grasp enzyme